MHRARQISLREGRVPRPIFTARDADLGDDNQIRGIGVKRFADELIGDVRAIGLARIDVIDAARHRLVQHRNRLLPILRRPEDLGSGHLHGPESQTLHAAIAKSEPSRSPDFRHEYVPA